MSLKDRLGADVKAAMKAGDKPRLPTLRLLLSVVKKAEIDGGKPLTEADEVALVQRGIKQRLEAAEAYRKAGRADSATAEEAEAEILRAYLPRQLDDAELEHAVREAVAATGAESMRDMGKVMGHVLKAHAGQVDGKRAKEAVTRALSAGS